MRKANKMKNGFREKNDINIIKIHHVQGEPGELTDSSNIPVILILFKLSHNQNELDKKISAEPVPLDYSIPLNVARGLSRTADEKGEKLFHKSFLKSYHGMCLGAQICERE